MAVGFKKKKKLLGQEMPNISSMPGTDAMQPSQNYGTGVMRLPEAEPEQPGLGTRILGDGWEGKAAALGGMLAGDGNAVARYHGEQAQAEKAQQAQAAAFAAEQRKRANGLADWKYKEQWKRDNPEAPDPTSMQRNYKWLKETQPDAAEQYLDRMTNDYEYRQGADGRFYRIDIAKPPTKPVGKLGPITKGGPRQPASGNFDNFKRAIIQQESGGRYGVANAEGSGAMGLGQIMPETARALAKQNNLPYRPELLSGSGAEARRYQDMLTTAATREAWKYGGGDIRKAAAYYFAGPNKKGWGPKTRRYQSDIIRRMGKR